MIRIVLFLLIVALFAWCFAWVADRPGDIDIVWLGQQIHTSVLVAFVALLVVIAVAILIVWLIR
jgi:HemY protein